ncbi:MAG: HD domain-containing phosphohydrolase [Acidobacteriota bacterium]
MTGEGLEALLARLGALCGSISKGSYDGANELFELTRAGAYPAFVTALAEAFGMMMVELEGREFRLTGMVEELRRSNERLDRVLHGTMLALASAIEKRDPYTAGHQSRVAAIAAAIATEMGLAEKEVDGIRIAGVLHDVGKICVPAEILCKPGRLTDVEFNLIKLHTEAGRDILANVEFWYPIAEIAYAHHERMDGSGYPRRLAGETIILPARIVAVADCVEAMCNHRPYRPALGMDAALAEISRCSGIGYDAEVVAACARLIRERRIRPQ